MLVNIKFRYMDENNRKVLDILSGSSNDIKNPFTGIYIIPHHNFGLLVANGMDAYPNIDGYHSGYGVCDTIDQWMEHYYESVIESPRKFCVALTKVRKVDQPTDGGWRWHKWGSYIGSKNPQYEYLYDEKDIDEVYCYHTYEIL